MGFHKDGMEINTLEAWERLAGPKSSKQWIDGRSAKETARAWLESGCEVLPNEVVAALERHPTFGPVLQWCAEPEGKLIFDDFRGEPRNSDLVVHAEDGKGKYLIAVEAKADETFGATVADTMAEALERYLAKGRSNGLARVQRLAQTLLGPKSQGDPHLKAIRYQLLTACAGAVHEAERCSYSRALMLVHEFVTDETDDAKHQDNAFDLNKFVSRMTHGSVASISAGEIVGPLPLPASEFLTGNAELYIGKVRRNIRSTTPEHR